MYSEILATSPSTQANLKVQFHSAAQPSDRPPQTVGLIVKAVDSKTTSHERKRLVKEAVDPKALKLEVIEFKNVANNTLLVQCKSKTDSDILEKELSKLRTVTLERPKRNLPTLLLIFVPKEIEDVAIRVTILQQNNVSHTEDPVINIKITKRAFEDSRHVVIEVSPNLRGELVALQKNYTSLEHVQS